MPALSTLSNFTNYATLSTGDTVSASEHNTVRSATKTRLDDFLTILRDLEDNFAATSQPTDKPEGKIWADTTSDPAVLKYYKDGASNLETIASLERDQTFSGAITFGSTISAANGGTLGGTFAGNWTASGVVTHTNNLVLSEVSPSLVLIDTNAGTDQQVFNIGAQGDQFRITILDDAQEEFSVGLMVNRSGTGAGIQFDSWVFGEGVIQIDDTTDATSTTDGSLQTDGGLSVAKAGFFGTSLEIGPGTNSDRARVGGVLHTNVTEVGNVGSGEDDLMSYTLPGGTLANDGESLEIEGSFEGNGVDAVTLKFYFGSTSFTINSGSSLGSSSGYSFIDVYIKVIRLGGSSEGIYGLNIEATGGGSIAYIGDSASENLSTDTTTKFTGENTNDASNDAVVQKSMIVKFRPAGP